MGSWLEGPYLSRHLNFSGLHTLNRASGTTDVFNKMLGREIYCNFVRDLISHSVTGCARYATTHGTLAICNWITAVPDVHRPALLACRFRKGVTWVPLHTTCKYRTTEYWTTASKSGSKSLDTFVSYINLLITVSWSNHSSCFLTFDAMEHALMVWSPV